MSTDVQRLNFRRLLRFCFPSIFVFPKQQTCVCKNTQWIVSNYVYFAVHCCHNGGVNVSFSEFLCLVKRAACHLGETRQDGVQIRMEASNQYSTLSWIMRHVSPVCGFKNWRITNCCTEPWASSVDRIYRTAAVDSRCRSCEHGTEAVCAMKFGDSCIVALPLTMFGTLVTYVSRIWEFYFSLATQNSDVFDTKLAPVWNRIIWKVERPSGAV